MLKMKRILVTLLGVILALGLSAAPLTREEARLRAIDFMKKTTRNLTMEPIKDRAQLAPRRSKATSTDQELYYVFSRGEGKGFVIVSGDDRVQAVIGYTEQGDFDYNQLPDNMRHWLDMRESELLELSTYQGSLGASHRAQAHDKIEPMVTTQWNQGSPYNDECPKYWDGKRSVTGCVATAMAQVLYFQRAKSVTETQAAIPGYTANKNDPNYGHLQVEGIPENSPIDWENMTNTYNSNSTAKQKKAVAQLMHYCGVSVRMDYTSSSSGAYSNDVPTAFQKYFGYGSSVRYIAMSSYTNDEWDKLLYQELEQGRPFYLSGHNSSGGHAFVSDGYDGNYCFHINWGWGGSSDGYYMLSKLKPGSQGIGGSEGGYSDGEGAVIGCEPTNYGSNAMPIGAATVKKICIENWDTNGDGNFSYDEAAAVTDLGNAFTGKNIAEFPELINFKGLTSIGDDAFTGCAKLSTIKLPKGIKRIGNRAFAKCVKLKKFTLPEGLTEIGDSAFAGCKILANQALPSSISRIEANTFEGCEAFTSVSLPSKIKYIGTNAFKRCTKLTNFELKGITPQNIVLGSEVFAETNVAEATLTVQQGLGEIILTADQWKDFGTIYEERTLSQGNFTTLEADKPYYLFNIGMGYYLNRGEAYGSQAIVASEKETPMKYEFRRKSSYADGIYYLYSDETGGVNHNLFRTSSDGKVGSGVKACFVDGPDSKVTDKSAVWKVALVEGTTNVYTLQVPSGQSGYKAGLFLGVQTDHASNVASPTYGLYYDVDYASNPENCQWMLVPYDEEASANYAVANQLKNLLDISKTKKIDYEIEQRIYNDFRSTQAELEKACRTLRSKLGFISFVDEKVRELATASAYDVDGNGEISFSEANSLVEIGSELNSAEIKDLSDLRHFTSVNEIYGNAFKGCTELTRVVLPPNLTKIYYQAFMNDNKLEYVEFGNRINYMGFSTFSGCTGLKEFRISVSDPATIELGEDLFAGVSLDQVTLYVPYGCKELYAQAPVWKDFGTIKEMRALASAGFSPLTVDANVYIYNHGEKKYLNRGEAYGTQAIIADNGMVYQLKRTNNMPAGTYYLYSEGTGNENKILFRTSTDGKVGKGVKACFVDGTLTANAYWVIRPVEGKENVYTLQTPTNGEGYVEGEYLGVDNMHESEYTTWTDGLYWDITPGDNPAAIEWSFVSYDEIQANQAFFDLCEELKKLIIQAEAQGIDAVAEQAVYDNFESSEQEISDAVHSLRSKLQYIDFADAKAKSICLGRWDNNEDGEISMPEAIAVTELGTAFKNANTMHTFDELQYFTSLTDIPNEAFRGCTSLLSLYIPQGVSTFGKNALQSCSSLKYMVLLNPNTVVDASATALPSKLMVFVPQSQLEAYTADEKWSTVPVTEYTGIPTVTAEPARRIYGRANPSFVYVISGAPVNGEPILTTDIDNFTPVGEYPITVQSGTITSPGLVLIDGVITIERAPATLTARSYSRNVGEENPEFQFASSTLRNSEKIDNVLLVQPTLECDATADSPAGIYEIRIFGAEAQNYEFTYVSGKLTVIDPTGVEGIASHDSQQPIYDLQGRRVAKPTRGLYIVGKHKRVVK